MTPERAKQYLETPNGGGRVALQQILGFYPDHIQCQTACEYFIEGFESRQPEIDELKKKIDELEKRILSQKLTQFEFNR